MKMELCRLCLQNINKIIDVKNNKDLLFKIKECVTIDITNSNNLNSNVCVKCIEKINDFYQFRTTCILLNSKDIQIDKTIEEDLLSNNVKFETKDTYDCVFCSDEFNELTELFDHQKSHDGEPVFKCIETNCLKVNTVFTTKIDLVKHESLHRIACDICGKMYEKSYIAKHIESHSGSHRCSVCSKLFINQELLKDHFNSSHRKKNLICDFCGLQFSYKKLLTVHLTTHSDDRRYKCELCEYSGKNSAALSAHKTMHADETHTCNICHKIFKSWKNLNDHLRRIHTEKKLKCQHCDSKFVEPNKLKVHERKHTGVKPYDCNLCSKSFSRIEYFKSHMITHGERTYHECHKCENKFATKKGLRGHKCKFDMVEGMQLKLI